MSNGYTRQSTGEIAPNQIVRATPLNAEFNDILQAFDSANGHKHDGTTGGGARIDLAGLSQGVQGTLGIANGGTDSTTASGARDSLGLTIGANVQAHSVSLDSIAGLTTDVGSMIFTTAANTYSVASSTAFGRARLNDASAADTRTAIGLGDLAIQNKNAVELTGGTASGIAVSGGTISGADITGGTIGNLSAAIAVADGGTGSGTASGARTNLGLGSAAVLDAGSAANQVVQLDGTARLPAVDGSQLTDVVPGVATANRPMGGFRHTNVDDAVARNEYATVGQIQDGAFIWCGTAGGTPNAITLTPIVPIVAYTNGQKFWFRAGTSNTSASNISVSGLPPIPVQLSSNNLVSNDIVQGLYYEVLFVSNTFQLSRISPTRIGHALLQATTQEGLQGLIGLTEANGLTPVGGIIDFGGQQASSNWLFANGQNVLRAQWPDLFARYGTIFGAGNGSTTFGTPDLRGRIVAGLDTMGGVASAGRLASTMSSSVLGAVGGNQFHVLTIAQMPSHGHALPIQVFGPRTPSQSNNPITGEETTATTGGGFSMVTSVEGGAQAHPIVQPTMLLNKLIFAGREVT